ncbi:thiol-disulfide oxidoreductase DCC family protein [Microbispora rosea]|uniref:thiol-disulfide oxidoreductase DCC family protein n=1 Tax=Microbispora rosea TaxID=58117 RepID=UPI000690686D|nr:DCC1-like thiol-disulfide oxidoreductase family protein [Microbispora rosea]
MSGGNRGSRENGGSGENRVLLVFDGDCAFCQACVNAGHRILPYMPAVRAWQGLDLDATGLTRAEVETSVQLLGPDGLRAHGARAIALLLVLQPRAAWRVAGRVMLTPPVSWLAEAGYRLVSRYRHLLPGSATCGTS